MTIATTEPQSVLTEQMEYARAVSVASMLPENYRGKPADIMLAVGLGSAMGLSPAESLYRISVIKGKPTASAELVAANVRKAGHRLRVSIEPGKATATIVRSDDPDFEFTVVRDAAWAQQMGLADQANYKKQGDTMLSWRAITAAARLACPEALYGVAYTSDELGDMGPSQRTTVEQTAPAAARMADILKPSEAEEASQGVRQSVPDSGEVRDPVSSPSASESDSSRMLTNTTKFGKAFYARMSDQNFADDQARIEYVCETIDRFVTSTKEITEDEARKVLARLDEEQGIADAELVQP